MTFYLVETQPRKYVEYLGRLAARPASDTYDAPQRTADFVAVFGSDWPMLQARMLRFIADLQE